MFIIYNLGILYKEQLQVHIYTNTHTLLGFSFGSGFCVSKACLSRLLGLLSR